MTTTNTQPATSNLQPATIGVFDSGFGGLTVLRALLPLIPGAHYIYLGDTARLPYGSKSHETIARYAVSSAKFLHEQGAELLVIACNTATALALEDIQQALPIPVIGVIQPGAQAASDGSTVIKNSAVTNNSAVILTLSEQSEPKGKNPRVPPEPSPTPAKNHVLVLATAATVQSHAYTRALNALGLTACEKACPLLVPLVEEGWVDHPVTDEVLRIYLTEALDSNPEAQTLLLGCTHYPLLEPAIRRTLAALGHPLNIIDSAESTARAVAAYLRQHPVNLQPATDNLQPAFYATDSIEKFQRLGSAFLGQPVTSVNLVDLGG
ncbi:MAG TPA: glutamate racemase [Edaphobacter sp.]|jgi:glutamate racemase|nr:glutamate racemase [Edaphobacter sp.]